MAKVNGHKRPEAVGMTLTELLADDGVDAARVACELNGTIVLREAYAATVLEAHDTLEVVHFVGGG